MMMKRKSSSSVYMELCRSGTHEFVPWLNTFLLFRMIDYQSLFTLEHFLFGSFCFAFTDDSQMPDSSYLFVMMIRLGIFEGNGFLYI